MRLRRKRAIRGYREESVKQLIESIKKPYEEQKQKSEPELNQIERENQALREEILRIRNQLRQSMFMRETDIEKGEDEDR